MKQYCQIQARVIWDFKQQKSKDRGFGLPTDNNKRFNRVYGNVNISIDPVTTIKIEDHMRKKTVTEQRTDKEIRQRVQTVSRLVHTYREPAKVRGTLYPSKQPPTIFSRPKGTVRDI